MVTLHDQLGRYAPANAIISLLITMIIMIMII